jgi:hypothetical protein
MSRRGLTSIAVALLLAIVPATAFADGAADDQYQDPLAAPTQPKQPKKAATAPTSAPAATSAPAGTSTQTSTSATQQTSVSRQELPRTGAPAGLIGLGGAGLIACGLALRRRTAEQ